MQTEHEILLPVIIQLLLLISNITQTDIIFHFNYPKTIHKVIKAFFWVIKLNFQGNKCSKTHFLMNLKFNFTLYFMYELKNHKQPNT